MLQNFKNRKQNEKIFPRKKFIRFLDRVPIKETPCTCDLTAEISPLTNLSQAVRRHRESLVPLSPRGLKTNHKLRAL